MRILLLLLFIFLMAFLAKKFYKKVSLKEILSDIRYIIPETLLLVITVAVFCPSSLFLSNIDEFAISYYKILPVIAGAAFLMSAVCFMATTLIWNKYILSHYRALVGSVAIGFYIQSNFLNPDMPELNGVEVDWSDFLVSGIISAVVWILLIVLFQILVLRKKEKFEKFSGYLCYFVSAVQLVSLVVLVLTTPAPSASNVVLTKEDEFTVGTDKNVIVFVLDSMGGEYFNTALENHTELKDSLEDFTFFRNEISGGAYTALGMPVLLTGIEFDSTYQGYESYLQEAWADTTIYEDLNNYGYDIRIMTDGRYMANVSDTIIHNAYAIGDTFYISDYSEFAKDLYKFAGIYTMPQIFKQYFWMYTEDITSAITATNEEDRRFSESDTVSGGEIYKFDDVGFYKDMLENGLESKYQNVYRVYHLFGPHAPFTMNENIEYVEETTEEAQFLGSMKIVSAYIDLMKEKGIYDNSTIIITADHGRAGSNGIQQNPALLVKQPNEHHELMYNDTPVHARNVVATVAKFALDDYDSYGPSVFDLDLQSDVERLHTVAEPVKVERYGESEEDKPFMRFIIPQDAWDAEKIIPYEPEQINRLAYTLGDKIDFAEESQYIDELDYRIYKENSMGIASNEFSMCLDLLGYTEKDLSLEFMYSKVYNDEQRLKIYVAGNLITDMTCRSESCGDTISVNIPKEYLQEKVLPIRMVFYNAVTPRQIGDGDDSRILSVGFDYFKVIETANES